jgi:3-oxoacyl-(acyl-carrier-protein) synthase
MTYINSTGLISPQSNIEDGHFVCIEPVYKEFINPVKLRRMSRILKMGLGASSICINHLPEAQVDAIIVGTGLACVSDLEKFLSSILTGNEEALSPTPFINSSHNTVGAQIAMMHQVTGYNNTYCHRGASFEAALQDALMLLEEGEAQQVLVGGIDEYSQPHQLLMSEEEGMKGAVPGEGAAFFILEKERRPNSLAGLQAVHSFLIKNKTAEDARFIKKEITDFLQRQPISASDVDVFIAGRNGHCANDDIYDVLEKDIFPHSETHYYKHLCGEYMTSTAFALDLAARRLSERKGEAKKYALIYNHYNFTNHSLILLQTL